MLRKWLGDTRGTVAVLTAVILPVVVGFLGLGAEVSYWYFVQRNVQSAADSAAYAAAVQLRVGLGQTEMEVAGLGVAQVSGFKSATGTATFNSPPVTGAFVGQQAVEVTLVQDVPRLLTSIFSSTAVNFSGRAVALVSPPSDACVIALDPSASGAVTFTGSAAVTLEACDVVANSIAPDAIDINGSATVSVDCLAAVGGVDMSGGTVTLNDCDFPVEDSHVFDDPFASMPQPDTTQPCEPDNTFGGPPSAVYNLTPGRYCGGFTVRRTVNLAPGVYVVDGGSMSLNASAVLSGTGVTFFLTNDATLSINGSADVQISAPSTGPYAGMLIYVDPDNDSSLDYTINGNASTFFNGAIYTATGTVRYNGSSSIGGGCTQVVARLVEVNGSAGLGTNCTGVGVDTAVGIEQITLVE